MGYFRFRRSIRLAPGIRINLGKRSASMSVGVRGAHMTFGGPRGTRSTVGLSGTGLSYTATSETGARAPRSGQGALGWLLLAVVGVVAYLIASALIAR